MQTGTILWQPDPQALEKSNFHAFLKQAEQVSGKSLGDFTGLHAWSVSDLEGFWNLLWDFCGVVGEKGGSATSPEMPMPGARFFPQSRLNFAENLLQRKGNGDAIVFRGEDKLSVRLSWDELHAEVSRMQQFLKAAGVGRGDRVAAMLPNMPQAVIGMLATSALGAVWSSCSPDFGEGGVLDRFGQIEPKVFISCDGYWYNGKRIEIAEKLQAIASKLTSAKRIVIADYLGNAEEVAGALPNAVSWSQGPGSLTASDVTFERLSFDHPLYILFSSGTTGIPKCIVHSQGGVLLQHLKEQQLHCNLNPGDRFFYFTTCGWMMWNWLVTGLASGATLMLFDGSPFAPEAKVLFDYAEQERFTFFGTSAKYIDAVRNSGLRPVESHDLSSLAMMTSTGSPLAPENFKFVYEGIKPDIHLASISGGTDIVACFVGGVPDRPVRVGEIQGPMLGMATEVWNDDAKPVTGEKGELVCTKAFPSMPIGFWNDPDNKKYHGAYFERFDGIWCHGDFAEWTENGGMIIHGRSDATLNPQGVRIGTAEIYNQVEQMPQIEEALCIGQDWQSDVRVVLFVRLAQGAELDEELTNAIKQKIRTGASPRHVPAKIIAVSDIPRTKSGKITELAVRDVVHGRTVKNKEALANPEALSLFEDLPQLRD
ncbi:acetoacetate--CoA ligase [Salaquimonas pukyongi]|uniref:acetoacetate--CoA ligase n=1 Tax=Salaquimonas pukyongi TaxID=2712698 RepID=UPI00096BA1A1|nr:acetoacetate--CoA ligase [Salaquimonas pukyongi]